MRVPKAIYYTVWGILLIFFAIAEMTGNMFGSGTTDNGELICGAPFLLVGIILLIRGIYYIKRGHY